MNLNEAYNGWQRVEMMPSPRRGLVGWVKDRIFGVQMKPQAVMVLDRHSQELLKEYMKNPEPLNNAVAACAVSAEDIKEATDRIVAIHSKDGHEGVYAFNNCDFFANDWEEVQP